MWFYVVLWTSVIYLGCADGYLRRIIGLGKGPKFWTSGVSLLWVAHLRVNVVEMRN